jgi:hypothetical protein
MLGNLVVWGKRWGRLPWSERFQSPLKLFVWLLGFNILTLVVDHFFSPLVQDWLSRNVNYLTGTSSGVVGVFYVWFIWSGEWRFTTGFKWVPPVVLFLTTVLNILTYHPEGLPISSSEITYIFLAVILIPIAFLALRIFRGKGEEGIQ